MVWFDSPAAKVTTPLKPVNWFASLSVASLMPADMPPEQAEKISAGHYEPVKSFVQGPYINFLTEDEGTDRIQASYGANLDRLAQVKSAWDPDNAFRLNKNIEPRA